MTITNNKKQFRFEAHLPDGELATLEYRWLKGSMVMMFTFVPATHRGTGVAEELVKHVLDHARAHHLKVKTYCSFSSQYVKDHAEYQDLLDA